MQKQNLNTLLNRFLLFGSSLLVIWLAYSFSLHFSELYFDGDQKYYTILYHSLEGARLADIPILQRGATGSSEPLYGGIAWVGAQFMEKSVWFSLINSAFLFALFLYLRSKSVSLFIYPLIFTNYYLFVLMFSAERLKVAILFILLYALTSGRVKYLWGTFAILSHFQSLMFAFGLLGDIFSKVVRGLIKGKLVVRPVLALLVIAIFGSVFLSIFSGVIIEKISYYEGEGIGEIIKSLVFASVALTFSKDKVSTAFVFLLLSFLALALGGERVNIIAFFIAIVPTFRWKRGINPVTVLILGYFSLNGLSFLSDVTQFGTGYP